MQGTCELGIECYSRTISSATMEKLSIRNFKGVVYNIQVEDLHCYSVGTNNVLVHNASGQFPDGIGISQVDPGLLLGIHTPPNVPLKFYYEDEWIYDTATGIQQGLTGTAEQRKVAMEAINTMDSWKDLRNDPNFTGRVRYISGTGTGPERFIRATSNPGNQYSINLVFAHGDTGNNGNVPTGIFNARKQQDGLPLFGMAVCYPGVYNRWIPDPYLIKGAPDDPGKISGGEMPSVIAPMIKTADQIIRKRLANNQPIEINLYFGSLTGRTITSILRMGL